MNNENMKTISELTYEDLCELLKFISTLTNATEKGDDVIGRFFPSLTAVQLLEFTHLCEAITNNDENARMLFDRFVLNNPDVLVDPEGKSEPVKKNFWEISLKSLDMLYELSRDYLEKNEYEDKTPNNLHLQAYLAMHPEGLNALDKSKKAYGYKRVMFFKKNQERPYLNNKRLNHIERALDIVLGSHKILNRVLDFIIEAKDEESYKVFVEHFFSRVDVLLLDTERKYPSNQVFYENLLKVEA